jgi:Resolvase, N terminal domain
MKLGYARVCSTDPNLTVQRYTLSAAGCDTINQEKSMNGRTQLEAILAFIRPGDALVVTRIDRLARNIGDLQAIVRKLAAKGARLQATDQPIDTGTAPSITSAGLAGKLFEHSCRHIYFVFGTPRNSGPAVDNVHGAEEIGIVSQPPIDFVCQNCRR